MFDAELACFSPTVSPHVTRVWELCGGHIARTEEEIAISDMFFCVGMSDPWLAPLTSRGVIVFWANWVLDSAIAGFRVPIADYVLDALFCGHPDSPTPCRGVVHGPARKNDRGGGSPATQVIHATNLHSFPHVPVQTHTSQRVHAFDSNVSFSREGPVCDDAKEVDSMLRCVPDSSGCDAIVKRSSSTAASPDAPKFRKFKLEFTPQFLDRTMPRNTSKIKTFKMDEILTWQLGEGVQVTRFVPGEEFNGRRFGFTKIE